MRRSQLEMPRLIRLFLLASAPLYISAHPFPRDDIHDAGYSYLIPRQCDHYCGMDNQFCCGGDTQGCFTSGSIAGCGGGVGVFTTTWTETNTYTSTVTTKWPAGPVDTSVPCVPTGPGETKCGWICCQDWQQCAKDGSSCEPRPGFTGGGGGHGSSPTPYIIFTTNGVVSTQYSAPFRVTGSGTPTPPPTGSAIPNTQGTSGRLSGGAIAGIVIGVLVGIVLLILICFCCIVKGLWNAIFGKKKEKRERVDVYEERYSGHGSHAPSSHHSRPDHHSGWFGGGHSSSHHKEKSSGKKWLGIGAAAATLLALLNMKKDKKRPRRARTAHSDSYFSYSDPSSSSSSSSGNRTRRSHRTHDTRGSRHSRSHR